MFLHFSFPFACSLAWFPIEPSGRKRKSDIMPILFSSAGFKNQQQKMFGAWTEKWGAESEKGASTMVTILPVKGVPIKGPCRWGTAEFFQQDQ